MNIIILMNRMPLIVFILYRLLYRDVITDAVWRDAFIISGCIALGVNSFLLYKGKVANRVWLGPNIFFIIGAMAFLFNITPILFFYKEYKGLAFLFGFLISGLITTFFSSLGFLGVACSDQKAVKKASFQLLGITVIAMIWSYFTNDYGLHISAALPFISLRIVSLIMIKRLGR